MVQFEAFLNIYFTIGVSGLILLLGAFFLLETDKISRHSKPYLVANIIGSALLAVYALSLQSWPFVVLESVWAAFSIYELALRKKTHKS